MAGDESLPKPRGLANIDEFTRDEAGNVGGLQMKNVEIK